MTKKTKYKRELLAIAQLQSGEGLKFLLDCPWGLANLIYKSGLHKIGKIHVVIDKEARELVVYRKPECKIWGERE